ncbi:phage Gp37/Gp68 family protein [Desulfosporosinus sp. FKA]|uniref:DUF5131 family protein n=1 Tax=Desulfosporosinus sp. FKA TaxID=1969834 RepID=UPI000B49E16F|nr:phage Gp37/Gp68 family protein [Desulfosporosinus sp. FKA]
MNKSKIEWTDAVWNPVTGCSKVSEGCRNCYAEREWRRLSSNSKTVYYGRKFNDVVCHPERLYQPLQWKKPRRIFVNSMSDLFHEDVPFEFIAKVYDIIKQCPQHTFQILTKRVDRALGFYRWDVEKTGHCPDSYAWLRNVWFIATTENQETANERIPKLLKIPAYTRGISAEPLLTSINLTGLIPPPGTRYQCSFCGSYANQFSSHCKTCGKEGGYSGSFANLSWVITGGESGPGARPTHPDWVRSLVDQCQATEVPFFFKQWGEWFVPEDGAESCRVCGCTWNNACNGGCYWIEPGLCSSCTGKPVPDYRAVKYVRIGKKKAGRLLDGRTWDELPEVSSHEINQEVF